MHHRKPRDRKHVNEFSGTLGDGHTQNTDSLLHGLCEICSSTHFNATV